MRGLVLVVIVLNVVALLWSGIICRRDQIHLPMDAMNVATTAQKASPIPAAVGSAVTLSGAVLLLAFGGRWSKRAVLIVTAGLDPRRHLAGLHRPARPGGDRAPSRSGFAARLNSPVERSAPGGPAS